MTFADVALLALFAVLFVSVLLLAFEIDRVKRRAANTLRAGAQYLKSFPTHEATIVDELGGMLGGPVVARSEVNSAREWLLAKADTFDGGAT